MEPAEYAKLRRYEDGHWWYVAQRSNLVEAVHSLPLRAGAKVLDAGCGTGRNLQELDAGLPIEAYGIDRAKEAAAFWNGKSPLHRAVASINELPFADQFFDAVVSVDVLGCAGVKIGRALDEVARVLRPGGFLVLLVPAYPWLKSTHDQAVHSVHRFTRAELAQSIADAGLAVERMTHRFAAVFPAVVLLRILRRFRNAPRRNEVPTSDLSSQPFLLNKALIGLLNMERRWLGRVPLPFGTTILLVARKED